MSKSKIHQTRSLCLYSPTDCKMPDNTRCHGFIGDSLGESPSGTERMGFLRFITFMWKFSSSCLVLFYVEKEKVYLKYSTKRILILDEMC